MNTGKIFEKSFRKSIPDSENVYCYRLKDGTASWNMGNSENVRFQAENIADFFLFYDKYLLILELKSHRGKSLPLNKVRSNQIKEMTEASKKLGVIPFLIVFFSDIERCFALRINTFNDFAKNNDRKSIPLSFFEEEAIEIGVKKLKTNYKFDINSFLEEF